MWIKVTFVCISKSSGESIAGKEEKLYNDVESAKLINLLLSCWIWNNMTNTYAYALSQIQRN